MDTIVVKKVKRLSKMADKCERSSRSFISKKRAQQPSVVRISMKAGLVVQDCDVYIGRACFRGGWKLKQSKWHNPYSVKKYGLKECIKMYEEHIRSRPDLLSSLSELEGKTLGCWCKKSPLDPCHGDVLIKLVQQHLNEEQGMDSKDEKKDLTEDSKKATSPEI